MGEKIVVGPINKGLRTDREPFVIDNDSFPVLLNAYQWRGRVKRKRGTTLLGRSQRYFSSTVTSYNTGSTTITLNGSGVGNLLTGFSLQTNGNIVPGSVTITAPGPTLYTDPSQDGTLSPSGTINYASGQITIAAQAGSAVSAVFRYYPDLPAMGAEDLDLNPNQNPGTLLFDTTYSYNILTSSPYSIYDVSFYKNPPTGTYAGYTQKTNITPTTWNGQDYQQFYTVNYQGALWATNGINIPFSVTNVGMQYKAITNVVIVAGGPPAQVTLTIGTHGLVVGDFVFINEVGGNTGINLQTGYVITVVDGNNVTVQLLSATVAGAYTSGGIAQYLTSRADTTKDCLRWYDGDPTNGSATAPTLNNRLGWVNFAPPLSQSSYVVSDLPTGQYYLVGARMIVPFKDRLLFIGPVVQTSSAGSQVYLQDTIIYSQNGTPYYTASFTGTVTSAATTFTPILVPTSQTSTASAFLEDSAGFGGFFQAGVNIAFTTVSSNEDVLILGMESISNSNGLQARLVYTGNDIVPFNMFLINSELGSSSTFSAINMDAGVITRGSRGYTITSQTQTRRIDVEIPDQVFEVNLTNNGTERVCAQRDFINEWIYFTYPSNSVSYKFPNQTLLYNYRDDSWAVFNESYTTYGQFAKRTGYTWATIGTVFPTWSSWNEPWNAGSSTLLQPEVIAGNQQGFWLLRDDGTNEGNSLYITSFGGSTITSHNHCLNNGDYIIISGCLGTIGSVVNGNIYSVSQAATNTFVLNPPIASGTYSGGGVIKRMYVPFIQTKQFPMAWSMSRKTRLGPQMYLFSTTSTGQVTLLIYLSQNADDPYNDGPIVPTPGSTNNALIYSTILYTCPESTNLGLTAANVNLQMPTAQQQAQTWHRMNTSLIGDTVQIGFSLNDTQMRDTSYNSQFSEIELHSMILDVNASQLLV